MKSFGFFDEFQNKTEVQSNVCKAYERHCFLLGEVTRPGRHFFRALKSGSRLLVLGTQLFMCVYLLK